MTVLVSVIEMRPIVRLSVTSEGFWIAASQIPFSELIRVQRGVVALQQVPMNQMYIDAVSN